MPQSIRRHLRRALTSATTTTLALLVLGAPPTPAHAAPSATVAATTSSDAPVLTDAQASAEAQSTGQPVAVDAATTPTDTLTANPDGTFTLTQAVEPVRKRISGTWMPLDATLGLNSDGTVSPAVTTSGLTLSGGGTGPLAVMHTAGRLLALTLPVTLPTPTLSGATATYPDVLNGVDLQVKADNQGGFSEVLIVKDAEAAADPALKTLAFATQTSGVTLSTDPAGNISAKDPIGNTIFAAPAPTMWDSATAPPATAPAAQAMTSSDADTTGSDPYTGDPLASSPDGPGVDAHVAPIKAALSGSDITLTPDADMLTSSSTVYPIYIDPGYSAGGSLQAWTYVNSYYADTSFWKTTDSAGLRVGYQGWDAPYYVGRTFAQMSVDSRLSGAHVEASHFYATEIYAPSCNATPVDLWWTGRITSDTTWHQQPSWIEKVASQNVAHGWSTSCPTASVGFDTTSLMQTAADNSASDVTLGLRAADESDAYGWKKFDHATMSMSTTYDHAPNTPGSLTTSPATSCTSTIKTVGNGDVTLYSKVSDPDGGTLSTTFKAWETNSSSTTVASGTVSATSGTTASLTIRKSTLDSKANNSVLKVSWNVQTSDGTYSSPTSKTCTFNFDPTIPGAPTLNDATGATCGDPASTASYTVGTSASFTITPNPGGSTPSGYLYQLNGAAPITTTKTSFSIKPTRGTDVLTVTALSAGGNIGDPAACVINAAAPATAAENDLTGDGIADLALVGKQTNLPAGLWLAPGQAGTGHTHGDGQVLSTASDIGAQGTGLDTNGKPADWNGTEAIPGHFFRGAGFNDILDYSPATGVGHILYGSGDGSALTPASGDEVNVPTNVFSDTQTSAFATHIATAGNLYNTANGYDTTGFPDLLLTLEGHLELEPAVPTPGGYVGADSAQDLADTNPTGTGTWTGWTISSTLVDGLPAMFARSDAGGQLYYYSPADMQNLALGNTASPVEVATTGWSASAAPVIQAADIDTDGTPDLWSLTTTGTATAHLLSGSTLTTQPAQAVTADSHTWSLTDNTDGTATTAADTSGASPLTLTGSGSGAQWDSGDLFDPDLTLNGTSSGVMTTSAALTTSADFSVSVWAKPNATGGVILSQDGTNTSGFTLYPDTTTKDWYFCMAQADSTTATSDCAHGGYVHLGAWTHLTATYKASTGHMAVYSDGIEANWHSHTPVSGFTGKFNVGQQLSKGSHTSYYNGSVSNVQVWAGTTLTPDQVAALSGTPGYVRFPSDSTDYTSGTTWTTAAGKLTFNAGQLTLTETGSCTTSCTWTQGETGHSTAVLTLQNDGNLVIYPQTAHTTGTALWSTGTYNHPNDTVFFQADGNLVAYDSDGAVLWSSGTYN